MPLKFGKLARFVMLFIGGVVGLVLLASLISSWLMEGDFFPTLRICLFIGGGIVLGVGALVGAGFSEGKIYGAAMMTGGHHSNYYGELQKERIKRRDDEFYFMLLMAGCGFLLMIFAFLLGL